MERLIMEFSVGDGYTYSADVTYPIVYSSKEDALTDFELMLMETTQILTHFTQERDKLYEKEHAILHKIRHMTSDKRTSEKDKQKHTLALSEELKEFREDKIKPIEDKINSLQKLHFGGQQFELSDFVYYRENDKKPDYVMPNIMTLDNFYATAEHNLSQSKKLKM